MGYLSDRRVVDFIFTSKLADIFICFVPSHFLLRYLIFQNNWKWSFSMTEQLIYHNSSNLMLFLSSLCWETLKVIFHGLCKTMIETFWKMHSSSIHPLFVAQFQNFSSKLQYKLYCKQEIVLVYKLKSVFSILVYRYMPFQIMEILGVNFYILV